MENIERMENELSEIFVNLKGETVGTEEYNKLLETADKLQKILKSETERQNDVFKVHLEEAKVDNEAMKLEIDRDNLELEKTKLKQSKTQNWWDIAKAGFGGFVGTVSSLSIILTSILLNNSGETLHPAVQRFLNGRKF